MVIAIFGKKFDLLKLIIILFLSSFLIYAPLIVNYFFILIDINTNDYFLINSILDSKSENSNVFLWFLEKIYFKLNNLFQNKIIFISGIIISIFLILN